ncbi:MAG: hypothetical protein IJN05_12205 [Ruminococcus sp.]|nr:hypothetical protein [Ruminococcus sp.]
MINVNVGEDIIFQQNKRQSIGRMISAPTEMINPICRGRRPRRPTEYHINKWDAEGGIPYAKQTQNNQADDVRQYGTG